MSPRSPGCTRRSGTAPVLVVDRPSWIQANLDGFRQILSPLNDKVAEKLKDTNSTMATIGPRITGIEVGALLSYLAPKVLGQFDPFFPGIGTVGEPGGRLLLVAPNIVAIERELGVDPTDFRLWVCLHEETHRVQFTAVGMAARLSQRTDRARSSTPPSSTRPSSPQMLRDGMKRVLEGLSGNVEVSIIDLVQTPAQKETVDRITAVMSLLEGHADVVMDGVGPEVIPTVDAIRAEVHRTPAGSGLRQDHPQAAGSGREDAAVSRRCRLLPQGDRPGRDDRSEPGVELARDAADQG